MDDRWTKFVTGCTLFTVGLLVQQICEKIVGFVAKALKLAQVMLNIHELISATVPSQIFSGTGILAKNPRWPLFSWLISFHYCNPSRHSVPSRPRPRRQTQKPQPHVAAALAVPDDAQRMNQHLRSSQVLATSLTTVNSH